MLARPDSRILGVAPSAWLAREASTGLWKHRRMELIPCGLDTSLYEPLDRELARRALGIPDGDKPLLLAAADHLNDPRKGTDLLLSALGQIGPVTLLTFGSGNPPAAPAGVRIVPLGRIDHERTKALAYNAADIYVHSARADNLPFTVMESISCGTPVAAFRVGGVPDMVRPGLTGWLASEVSAAALADTICQAMSDIGRTPLRAECRRVAETDYSLGLQAERYERLFESVNNPARALSSTASTI
jgi:glycosyltransferase involved in cell wall biosynthesis